MAKAVDLTGMRFGRLRVTQKLFQEHAKYIKWICLCDCGNTKVIMGCNMMGGRTVSCGCLNRQRASETLTTHGQYGTRLYKIWQKMKERCNYRKDIHYYNYGGRGISVCDEWQTDYMCFRTWAMDNGYRHNLTIDRADNDGNYNPQNCKWSTNKEQCNNTRNNIMVTINSITHTLSEWADMYGIKYRTASTRYRRDGKTGEDIFLPVKQKQSMI